MPPIQLSLNGKDYSRYVETMTQSMTAEGPNALQIQFDSDAMTELKPNLEDFADAPGYVSWTNQHGEQFSATGEITALYTDRGVMNIKLSEVTTQ